MRWGGWTEAQSLALLQQLPWQNFYFEISITILAKKKSKIDTGSFKWMSFTSLPVCLLSQKFPMHVPNTHGWGRAHFWPIDAQGLLLSGDRPAPPMESVTSGWKLPGCHSDLRWLFCHSAPAGYYKVSDMWSACWASAIMILSNTESISEPAALEATLHEWGLCDAGGANFTNAQEPHLWGSRLR